MTRRSGGRSMSIGAVLESVRPEFPDVTISKIRFLEAEGLLTPARTPSGYRQFTPADVERLLYILRAQRDHFWPLRVIADALDALDRGLEPRPEAGDARPRPPAPTPDPDLADPPGVERARTVRLTRPELARAAGTSEEAIGDLEQHGLLHPGPEGHFDDAALRVAAAATGLTEFGLEPRHLRAFRTTADREVGLIQQAVAGRPASTRSADTAAVARLALQLHAALLKAGLEHP